MIWYFDIINRVGAEYEVENPVGWDGTALDIDRDDLMHGVFFQYQGNQYEYHDLAATLLMEEYEDYGIEGKMQLRISLDCGFGKEELGIFDFVFEDYEDAAGDDCWVKITVEESNGYMLFKNRFEQKVDLGTTLSFDGVGLPSYTALPFTTTLPAKSIYVEDRSKVDTEITGPYVDSISSTQNGSYGFIEYAFFNPAYDKQLGAEIGGYTHPVSVEADFEEERTAFWSNAGLRQLPYSPVINAGSGYIFDYVNIDLLTPIVNYDKDLGPIFGTDPITGLSLDIHFSGHIEVNYEGLNPVTDNLQSWNFYLCKRNATDDTLTWFSDDPAVWSVKQHDASIIPNIEDLNLAFSRTWNLSGIALGPGDRLYYFFLVTCRRNWSYTDKSPYNITYQVGNYFHLHGLSKIPDTTAKVFAVNEALSRVSEAITNNKLRVYSQYFGRTDSQPYTVMADGCGSRETITNGLFVRRMEDKLLNRPPVFSLSMKDMWEGLNPIHNLGLGLEPDPNRGGFNMIRIEPWDYFYKLDVVLVCNDVQKLRRRPIAAKHYSIFRFGYNKWEAEEFNGIDEFLTAREYRTEITATSATLEQKSAFIASGFALEVTRRKGNEYSDDWRYDNDTFIICMTRNSGALVVEQGNISNADQIMDPATIYNWRIRPAYNAMRWMPAVMGAYRNVTNASKLIFTKGDGNVYATGKITGSFCIVSDDILSEKDTLTPSVLNTPADGKPIYRYEDVTFDYPLTVADYKQLKTNPHGLIQYSTNGVSGYGWIRKINYKPNDGIATFTLIPKI